VEQIFRKILNRRLPIVTDRVTWSVGLSVGLSPSEPWKRDDRDADSGGPRESRVAYNEPLRANTVLCSFNTIQPSSYLYYYPHMPIGKVWSVDISFTVCLCFLFVCLFVCTVTHFSAKDKFCTAVHRRRGQGIFHFCELCSPRNPTMGPIGQRAGHAHRDVCENCIADLPFSCSQCSIQYYNFFIFAVVKGPFTYRRDLTELAISTFLAAPFISPNSCYRCRT